MDISELSSGNINSNSNEIDDRQYISGEISITPTDDDSDADADEDVEDSDGRRTTSPVNLPPFLKKLIQDKVKPCCDYSPAFHSDWFGVGFRRENTRDGVDLNGVEERICPNRKLNLKQALRRMARTFTRM